MLLARKIQLKTVDPRNHISPSLQKLLVYSQDSIEVICLDDILSIQAIGNYSSFFLMHSKSICASKTLKYYEDLLHQKKFFRVHNSWLINIDKLQKIRKVKGYVAELETGLEVPISRSRKQALLLHLENMYL